MMDDLEYDTATRMESSWALRGGVLLIVAFLCPLIAGPRWVFFTDLLGQDSMAGIRVMTLAPLFAGVIALVAHFKMKGLNRPMALLLAAGFCNVLILGVVDAYVTAVMNMAERLPPELLSSAKRPPSSLLLGQVSVTLAFVGLAYTNLRPTAKFGPMLAGGAGIAIIVLLAWPVNGVALKAAFDGDLWSHFWALPVTILLGLGFALICVGVLFDVGGERDDLANLGILVGLGMLVAPGIGLFFFTLSAGGGALTLMAITVTIKVYGTFVALHILFAAGFLGWLVHGLQPE